MLTVDVEKNTLYFTVRTPWSPHSKQDKVFFLFLSFGNFHRNGRRLLFSIFSTFFPSFFHCAALNTHRNGKYINIYFSLYPYYAFFRNYDKDCTSQNKAVEHFWGITA
jgi:hypothetical protein